MTLWLAVTPDKYELPIAVADTQQKLADMLGVTSSTIAHKAYAYVHGLIKKEYRTGRKAEYWVINTEIEED